MPDRSVVILGVGNELMRDDGVGVHVVRRLREEWHDDRVELIEAGTAVVEAIDLVPSGAKVVVVDAASGGGAPGSTYRWRLDDVASERVVSLHETSLPEAFAVARLGGSRLGGVLIVGVEPAVVEVGTELSPALTERLPAVLETVQAEVARLLRHDS